MFSFLTSLLSPRPPHPIFTAFPSFITANTADESVSELAKFLDSLLRGPNPDFQKKLLETAGRYKNFRRQPKDGQTGFCLDEGEADLLYIAACCAVGSQEGLEPVTTPLDGVTIFRQKERGFLVVLVNDAHKAEERAFQSILESPDGVDLNSLLTLQESSVVRSALDHLLTNTNASHIVFTAYSLSSLTATRIFLTLATSFHAQTTLITFGALPTFVSRPTTLKAFAVINAGDPIPKATKPYLRSLLDLYRLAYGFLPFREQLGQCTGPGSKNFWRLPEQGIWAMGEKVVLWVESGDSRAEREGKGRMEREAWGEELWCEVGMHKKEEYWARVRAMWEASNGRRVWGKR